MHLTRWPDTPLGRQRTACGFIDGHEGPCEPIGRVQQRLLVDDGPHPDHQPQPHQGE